MAITDTIVNRIVPRAKVALNTTTTDPGFIDEIIGHIKTGYVDLEIAGIDVSKLYVSSVFDELLLNAIITYVCYRFALNRGYDATAFKRAYDDQKTLLQNSSSYNLRMEDDGDE